jgi:glycosyltransferase involved in cell wall biosynthesis
MGTRLLMFGGVNHPHVEHLALGLRARGFDVIVAGDAVPGLPVSVLEEEGFRLLPAPLLRRGSARGMVQHVRWIRRLLETERPEVVHAHWLCGYAAFAAVAGAAPLVSMAWGSDVYRARRLQNAANRVAVRRSALVMADSQDLLDRVVEIGADPARSVLVNWGVDLARFRPADAEEKAALREQLGLGLGPVILSMRSLMPIYNPRVILDAWARIAAERPDAQFVLKHMGVVTTDVGELPFPERVHVVGHIPYERMADYYRAADAAVSIASSDSAPRSVFEAMACGAACVISDLPWTHEQIADEREALLVPVSVEAVAAALRRVLDEPETARRLADNGRGLVEREHDRELHLDRLADTYRSLLQPAGLARSTR